MKFMILFLVTVLGTSMVSGQSAEVVFYLHPEDTMKDHVVLRCEYEDTTVVYPFDSNATCKAVIRWGTVCFVASKKNSRRAIRKYTFSLLDTYRVVVPLLVGSYPTVLRIAGPKVSLEPHPMKVEREYITEDTGGLIQMRPPLLKSISPQVHICVSGASKALSAPIVRGCRGLVTYIDGIPVTSQPMPAISSYNEMPIYFNGVPAEFENACESPKAIFR